MKRTFVVMIVTLILTGCTMDKQPPPPTQQSQTPPTAKEQLSIRPVSLEGTDEGWTLKSTGADNSTLYEIKGTMQAKSVQVWFDHFVKGKPAESEARLDVGSMRFDSSERLIKMYFHRFTLDNEKQMWVFSLRGKTNNSGSQRTTRQNVTPLFHSSSLFTTMGSDNVRLGKPVDLMVMVFAGKNNGTSIGELSETIRTNDEVYILRCQFD